MNKIIHIILSIILLLIIFAPLFFLTVNLETFDDHKKKYAVCVWGELRGIKNTVDSFYTNLVRPLNADVFICCQKTNSEIDENINLFKENIIMKELYDKPNLNEVYYHLNELVVNNNYRNDSNLQMYYNFKKINDMFGKILEDNYDYIILTRSDFLYLFEFPDIIQLTGNSDIIWTYDKHDYGGINMCLICVPFNYIRKYLTSTYDYLNDHNNVLKLNGLSINNEKLYKLYFEEYNWEIGKITPNSFISADSANEITTWAKIRYSDERNVYYKYEEQMNDAYSAYEQYRNGSLWKYIKTDIDRIVV